MLQRKYRLPPTERIESCSAYKESRVCLPCSTQAYPGTYYKCAFNHEPTIALPGGDKYDQTAEAQNNFKSNEFLATTHLPNSRFYTARACSDIPCSNNNPHPSPHPDFHIHISICHFATPHSPSTKTSPSETSEKNAKNIFPHRRQPGNRS